MGKRKDRKRRAKVLVESMDYVESVLPYELLELDEDDWEVLAEHFQFPNWESPPMFYKTLTVVPRGFKGRTVVRRG